eukprot:2476404-Prymnesium_polylepis.2
MLVCRLYRAAPCRFGCEYIPYTGKENKKRGRGRPKPALACSTYTFGPRGPRASSLTHLCALHHRSGGVVK